MRLTLGILFLTWFSLDCLHAQISPTWIDDVCRPPGDIVEKMDPAISVELGDIEEINAADLDTWLHRRVALRKEWQDFLGPMPAVGDPVEFSVLESVVVGTTQRQLVRYSVEPGVMTEGYLFFPSHRTAQTKLPAIVALHPTTQENIDEIAGLHQRSARATGLRLAEHGFVVFCPRCFLWENVATFDAAVAEHRTRHPNTLGMAKMLFDAQRAVDLLQSLPFVDRKAIGAFGHSLGAKESLYLTAFDERISAAVASEGGLTFHSTNWDAPWYLGQAIHGADFRLNHHQLLALIAPRPLLILGGESGPGAADGVRSWPLVIAARPVWSLYTEKPRVGILNHGQGHRFGEEQLEKTLEWFESMLKPAEQTGR